MCFVHSVAQTDGAKVLDDGCASEANSRFDSPAWLAFAACSRAADDSVAPLRRSGTRVTVRVVAATSRRPLRSQADVLALLGAPVRASLAAIEAAAPLLAGQLRSQVAGLLACKQRRCPSTSQLSRLALGASWRLAVVQGARLRVEVLVRLARTTVRPSARHLAACLVHAVVPVVAAAAAVAAPPAAELAAAIPRSELHILGHRGTIRTQLSRPGLAPLRRSGMRVAVRVVAATSWRPLRGQADVLALLGAPVRASLAAIEAAAPLLAGQLRSQVAGLLARKQRRCPSTSQLSRLAREASWRLAVVQGARLRVEVLVRLA